ncbi:hypothetical protein MKQ70_06650 [Chitinophaga sedimenti]|uniref:hypothetical protein n=1 Tax=Chitinophaga sedimenti TaxID=2033606 RepID=UPI0020038F7E|nr:hypothetical protein [Chitinophaga sedimenti]MCK7554696.1 hypothetical protein [Chitinophaga sedimenti]
MVFDANSGFTAGNNTVSLSGNSWCHNMTWTSVTGAPIVNMTAGMQLEVWGSISLDPTMTINGSVTARGTEVNTLTTNGCSNGTLSLTVNKENTAGGMTLTDNINFPGLNFVHARGQLNMSGRNINMNLFNSTSGVGRIMDISNATINVVFWNVGATNVTWVNNAAGSFITSRAFTVNGLTYPKVYCTTSVNEASIQNATFGELVFTNTAPANNLIGLIGNNTVGTLEFKSGAEIRGNNTITNLLLAPSKPYTIRNTQTVNGLFRFSTPDCNALGELRGVEGTSATINFGPAATRDLNNIYLLNMTAAGSGLPVTVSGADASGNTGFDITASGVGARYWVGGSGDWSDPAHWSNSSGGAGGACVPGVSNDVFFDANSFSSGSNAVTINNTQAYCRNMTGQARPSIQR